VEWQFDVELNDLGRAFLLVDDFMTTPEPLLEEG